MSRRSKRYVATLAQLRNAEGEELEILAQKSEEQALDLMDEEMADAERMIRKQNRRDAMARFAAERE